jgi:hypothetical protein
MFPPPGGAKSVPRAATEPPDKWTPLKCHGIAGVVEAGLCRCTLDWPSLFWLLRMPVETRSVPRNDDPDFPGIESQISRM